MKIWGKGVTIMKKKFQANELWTMWHGPMQKVIRTSQWMKLKIEIRIKDPNGSSGTNGRNKGHQEYPFNNITGIPLSPDTGLLLFLKG